MASLKTSAPSLDPVPYGLQFVDHWVWIRAFNIEYFVGVDGISMAMVVLTALVSFVATLSSVKIRKPVEPDHQSIAGIKVKERAYYALLLLETGMMGVFVSLDLFLFYVFWELMLLGLASFTQEWFNGAVLQMFNHGTITSMMFLLVGVIYDRAHHRDLEGFGGLAHAMPVYTGFSGLAFMAALGLPGLSGFVSEALVFLGAFQTQRVATIISASGVVLAACYVLWTIHRVFLGPLKKEEYGRFADLNWREWLTLAPLALIVVVLGFYPMPVLDLMSASLGALRDWVVAAG